MFIYKWRNLKMYNIYTISFSSNIYQLECLHLNFTTFKSLKHMAMIKNVVIELNYFYESIKCAAKMLYALT